jgi:hypothetical protein
VEAEFVKADKGIAQALGHGDASDLGGRPDAQAFAFGPQSIDQRDVEGVEFDTSVEAIFQVRDDVGAEKGLSAMQSQIDDPGRDDQGQQKNARNPLDPLAPATE